MNLRKCLLPALVVASVACKSEKKGAPQPDPPAPSASTLASGSPVSRPHTNSEVDLLTWTDAKVIVSSKVDNPHDFPEHLCDGKPETAWNGKTGDLHAAIDVALPSGAFANSIGIVVGFDRKKTGKAGAEEDLFLENYRIKKIRITPESGAVQEVELSIDKRELQRISIPPTAKFRVEVVEAVAGTQKSWREIVVSEFRVFGTPGTARLAAPRTPDVSVASKPELSPKNVGDVSEKTVAAYCAAWSAKVKPLLHQRYEVEGNYPGPIPEPYCDPKGTPLVVDQLPSGISSAFLLSRTNVTATESVLAFTTGDHVATPFVLASTDHGDPGCGGYLETKDVHAEAVTVLGVGGVLVSWVVGTQTNAYPGSDGSGAGATDAASHVETRALLCQAAGGGVTCIGNGKDPAIFGAIDGSEHLTAVLPKYRRVALTVDGSGKIVAR